MIDLSKLIPYSAIDYNSVVQDQSLIPNWYFFTINSHEFDKVYFILKYSRTEKLRNITRQWIIKVKLNGVIYADVEH